MTMTGLMTANSTTEAPLREDRRRWRLFSRTDVNMIGGMGHRPMNVSSATSRPRVYLKSLGHKLRVRSEFSPRSSFDRSGIIVTPGIALSLPLQNDARKEAGLENLPLFVLSSPPNTRHQLLENSDLQLRICFWKVSISGVRCVRFGCIAFMTACPKLRSRSGRYLKMSVGGEVS